MTAEGVSQAALTTKKIPEASWYATPEAELVTRFDNSLETTQAEQIKTAIQLYEFVDAVDELQKEEADENTLSYKKAEAKYLNLLHETKASPVLLKYPPLSNAVIKREGSAFVIGIYHALNELKEHSHTFLSEERAREIKAKLGEEPITTQSIESILAEETIADAYGQLRERVARGALAYDENIRDAADIINYIQLEDASNTDSETWKTLATEYTKNNKHVNSETSILRNEFSRFSDNELFMQQLREDEEYQAFEEERGHVRTVVDMGVDEETRENARQLLSVLSLKEALLAGQIITNSKRESWNTTLEDEVDRILENPSSLRQLLDEVVYTGEDSVITHELDPYITSIYESFFVEVCHIGVSDIISENRSVIENMQQLMTDYLYEEEQIVQASEGPISHERSVNLAEQRERIYNYYYSTFQSTFSDTPPVREFYANYLSYASRSFNFQEVGNTILAVSPNEEHPIFRAEENLEQALTNMTTELSSSFPSETIPDIRVGQIQQAVDAYLAILRYYKGNDALVDQQLQRALDGVHKVIQDTEQLALPINIKTGYIEGREDMHAYNQAMDRFYQLPNSLREDFTVVEYRRITRDIMTSLRDYVEGVVLHPVTDISTVHNLDVEELPLESLPPVISSNTQESAEEETTGKLPPIQPLSVVRTNEVSGSETVGEMSVALQQQDQSQENANESMGSTPDIQSTGTVDQSLSVDNLPGTTEQSTVNTTNQEPTVSHSDSSAIADTAFSTTMTPSSNEEHTSSILESRSPIQAEKDIITTVGNPVIAAELSDGSTERSTTETQEKGNLISYNNTLRGLAEEVLSDVKYIGEESRRGRSIALITQIRSAKTIEDLESLYADATFQELAEAFRNDVKNYQLENRAKIVPENPAPITQEELTSSSQNTELIGQSQKSSIQEAMPSETIDVEETNQSDTTNGQIIEDLEPTTNIQTSSDQTQTGDMGASTDKNFASELPVTENVNRSMIAQVDMQQENQPINTDHIEYALSANGRGVAWVQGENAAIGVKKMENVYMLAASNKISMAEAQTLINTASTDSIESLAYSNPITAVKIDNSILNRKTVTITYPQNAAIYIIETQAETNAKKIARIFQENEQHVYEGEISANDYLLISSSPLSTNLISNEIDEPSLKIAVAKIEESYKKLADSSISIILIGPEEDKIKFTQAPTVIKTGPQPLLIGSPESSDSRQSSSGSVSTLEEQLGISRFDEEDKGNIVDARIRGDALQFYGEYKVPELHKAFGNALEAALEQGVSSEEILKIYFGTEDLSKREIPELKNFIQIINELKDATAKKQQTS
ncbi:MAG TPA: hypothetical protein VLF89_07570 [Candidatus Saccharimonadales bacterium]|nr:hypothetical protein [Candidatus Saccharimonadales bacterium]